MVTKTAGTIIQVDPTTLTIALNVRTDANVDKEFVASIKELGILQPPMVVANDAGSYDVVLGQRRVLAAVQAELKQIPVYLVDKSEAEAARIVDQITENEQRQHLTEAERVGGYKQLALIGLSPSQIAKKVSRPRKSIDTALAIADNEQATAALDEGMTLDQAAVLVEFTDDKAAVKRLTESAAKGDFDHTVKDLRDKRAFDEEQTRLEQELKSEKLTFIAGIHQEWDRPGLDGHTLTDLTWFGKPGKPTEQLEPADVKKKTALAGSVARTYMEVDGEHKYWPVKRYWLVDPDTAGFEKLQTEYSNTTRELTPEEQAAEAEREAKWAKERAEREAIDAAAKVRTDWIIQFLQRKSLPALNEVLTFIAATVTRGGMQADHDVFKWLGAPLTREQIESMSDDEHNTSLMDLASRVGPQKYLLAAAFDSCESAMNYDWQRDDVAPWYLPQLAALGYGLSDIEKALAEPQTEAEEEATPEAVE